MRRNSPKGKWIEVQRRTRSEGNTKTPVTKTAARKGSVRVILTQYDALSKAEVDRSSSGESLTRSDSPEQISEQISAQPPEQTSQALEQVSERSLSPSCLVDNNTNIRFDSPSPDLNEVLIEVVESPPQTRTIDASPLITANPSFIDKLAQAQGYPEWKQHRYLTSLDLSLKRDNQASQLLSPLDALSKPLRGLQGLCPAELGDALPIFLGEVESICEAIGWDSSHSLRKRMSQLLRAISPLQSRFPHIMAEVGEMKQTPLTGAPPHPLIASTESPEHKFKRLLLYMRYIQGRFERIQRLNYQPGTTHSGSTIYYDICEGQLVIYCHSCGVGCTVHGQMFTPNKAYWSQNEEVVCRNCAIRGQNMDNYTQLTLKQVSPTQSLPRWRCKPFEIITGDTQNTHGQNLKLYGKYFYKK
jgi:hypothetical protein